MMTSALPTKSVTVPAPVPAAPGALLQIAPSTVPPFDIASLTGTAPVAPQTAASMPTAITADPTMADRSTATETPLDAALDEHLGAESVEPSLPDIIIEPQNVTVEIAPQPKAGAPHSPIHMVDNPIAVAPAPQPVQPAPQPVQPVAQQSLATAAGMHMAAAQAPMAGRAQPVLPSATGRMVSLRALSGEAAVGSLREIFAEFVDSTRSAEGQSAVGSPAPSSVSSSTVGGPAAPVTPARMLTIDSDGAWLTQLAQDIAQAADGDAPVRFRLAPAMLGAMLVELSRDVGGDSASTTICLTTETEAARMLVADGRGRLADEARAHGVRVNDIVVTRADPAAERPVADPARGEPSRSDQVRSDLSPGDQQRGDRRPTDTPRRPNVNADNRVDLIRTETIGTVPTTQDRFA
jgi:hypothetical protein